MKLRLFTIFVLCFLAFGCVSRIPITEAIIQEIGGIDNADQFQYYISRSIILTLVDTQISASVEDGQLIRDSSTVRESIHIRGNLPGLVRSSLSSSANSLGLAGIPYTITVNEYITARDASSGRTWLMPRQVLRTVIPEISGPVLHVAFEEYEGNFPTLAFGQYTRGSLERYYLLYEDADNRIVQYGDNRYRISFDEEFDEPFLLIKGNRRSFNTSTTRRASGLTLEN